MSETGHARNVGNFETLISFCTGYGAAYDPSNASIDLGALSAKLLAAQGVLGGVSTAVADQKIEINNRQEVFEGVRKLVTRVVNSFDAGGAAKKDVDDARTFKRKIDGARAEALDVPAEGEPPLEDNSISVSQQSYVQLVEHFTGLIELLIKSGSYGPNEVELKVVQLTAKRDAMADANTAVINKLTVTSNARIDRNTQLYDETTGLVDLAMLVKKYVKSVFGADSAEYGQISGLRFDRY